MNTFYIYGLFSTKDEIIKYIGYTSDLKERLKEHNKDINRVKVKTYKKNWIKKCISEGYNIDYLILDTALTQSEACELEKFYIQNYLENNVQIVNGTLGGDGGIMTEESRRKLSKSCKGRIMSLETRNKISESKKGTILSEETKRKMSESQKRIGNKIIFTDEVRKKLSDRMTGIPGLRKGKLHSEESKLKISESKKGTVSSKRKEVLQIDPKTKEIIKTFDSLLSAIKETRINNIHRCITQKRKTAGNYEWKYKL